MKKCIMMVFVLTVLIGRIIGVSDVVYVGIIDDSPSDMALLYPTTKSGWFVVDVHPGVCIVRTGGKSFTIEIPSTGTVMHEFNLLTPLEQSIQKLRDLVE